MNTVLKDLRAKANLTQLQAGNALGVGQSTISMWENGESTPQVKMLPKIAEVYGCSIEDIFKCK